MIATYEPIKTYTTTGVVAGITLSDIPQTYTHLVLISNAKTSTGLSDIGVQLNGDSASNYNYQMLYANGTTGGSYRTANNRMQITDWSYADSNIFNNSVVYFHSYTDTSLWKTCNFKSVRGNSGGGVDIGQCYWRNTSSINSMYIFGTTQSLAAGCTFNLYGIKVG